MWGDGPRSLCLTARLGQPGRERGSNQTMGERLRESRRVPAAGQCRRLAREVGFQGDWNLRCC